MPEKELEEPEVVRTLKTWGNYRDIRILSNAVILDSTDAGEYFYGAVARLGLNATRICLRDVPDIISEAIEAYYALEGNDGRG